MLTIDLNCDIGEGMTNDAMLMPLISSANIACGGHAGDVDTMKQTVALAIINNVAIGAHPSFVDKENFGRIDLLDKTIQLTDIAGLIQEQVLALKKICGEMGAKLHHIKPHGALYNRAAVDFQLSKAICSAILEIDKNLFFYGLSRSSMSIAAEEMGVTFISEVFADRTYMNDGSLTPRTHSNALITDELIAEQQVLKMIKEEKVISTSGRVVPLDTQTICLHGDGAHALAFAARIRKSILENGITIKAP